MGPRRLDLRSQLPSLLLIPAGFLTVVRLTGWSLGLLPLMLAALPWTVIPAVASAAMAWRQHRRLLASMGAALALLIGFWWAPWFIADTQPSRQGPVMRIAAMNLMSSPQSVSVVRSQLAHVNPDLVVVEEISPQLSRELAAQLRIDYPHAVLADRRQGLAVFSAWPLSDVTAVNVLHGGVRLSVAVPEYGRLTFIAAHPASPRWTRGAAWAADQNELHSAVQEVRGRVIVAGDLNMTADHVPFRKLLSLGLRDAAEVVGARWQPTWSLLPGFPSVATIDHMLVRGYRVENFKTFSIPGSNHRGVFVDIAPATSAAGS